MDKETKAMERDNALTTIIALICVVILPILAMIFPAVMN